MTAAPASAQPPPPPAPRVLSQKPPIPTLWLDTSVGIKLAKLHRRENLHEIEISRLRRLREFVLELTSRGKLLCPTSDQEEEYEAERLDSEVFAEFSRLSRGVRMNHRYLVERAQIYTAMDAFCHRSRTIHLPWRIYFHEDPLRTMEREKGRRVIVSMTTPPDSPILLARRNFKKDDRREMEQLRRGLTSKGQTYDVQVKSESLAFARAFIRTMTGGRIDSIDGRGDFWTMSARLSFLEYVDHWKHLGGQPRAFLEFLVSEYMTSLPTIKVRSQLRAELATGNQRIESGDPGDVNLLSVAAPLAHFVLADKRMERRMKRLGIDSEWGAKIYSMSTIEGLFAELQAL